MGKHWEPIVPPRESREPTAAVKGGKVRALMALLAMHDFPRRYDLGRGRYLQITYGSNWIWWKGAWYFLLLHDDGSIGMLKTLLQPEKGQHPSPFPPP